jgi:pimeloyl-ACP methyl ester carboxylesterase
VARELPRIGSVLALSLVWTSCAGKISAQPAAPYGVHVDAPLAGTFIRDPEVEVSGTFTTYDGRGWVWVDSVAAHVDGNRFTAHRVPLSEGATQLGISLTDGRGQRFLRQLPLVVETPDRPRPDRVCVETGACLDYEVRGRPRRDAEGRITNAVVVLTSLGFSERLDELWPELIGPGRALDTHRLLIVGVAPARTSGQTLATAEENVRLLDHLATTGRFQRPLTVMGAASLGTELALRWLSAHPESIRHLIACGGHDRPFAEPVVQDLHRYLQDHPPPQRRSGQLSAWWRGIVEKILPATFTDRYLDDDAHAAEWSLELEAKSRGMRGALTDAMRDDFMRSVDPRDVSLRIADAMSLAQHPVEYHPRAGTRVRFVANRLDRSVSIRGIEDAAETLRRAGAQVEVSAFEDPRGHAVFFRSSIPLAASLGELEAP